MKIYFFLILSLPFSRFAVLRALNTAATGMAVQEMNVGTISNNIANVNTTGFKKQRAESEDLLYETVLEPGARSSNDTFYNVGIQIGSGAKVSGVRRQFSQGSPIITNNPYDLMIEGEGYFAVAHPTDATVVYTRDGSFSVNSQGLLVTNKGYQVVPGITLPNNTSSLAISENGQVEAYIRDQIEPVVLGQIPVVTFINPGGLKDISGNMHRQTSASGNPVTNVAGENGAGGIKQGILESSNVSIMVEMTDLIRAQRAYELNSKVMAVADQMMQTVNEIR